MWQWKLFHFIRTYLWQEDKSKKTKLTITAPQYIDYVMTYIQKQVYDNALFPSKYGEYVTYIY